MPVFTIQAPDGRKLTIDAPDQQTAMQGAQDYVSKNPAGQSPTAAVAQSTQPQQAPPDTSPLGVASQGLSGVNEGIAGVLGFPVDATEAVLRAGAAGVHALGGPDIQLPVDAFGGSQTIKNLMGPAITPETGGWQNEMARRVGQELGASAIPMMGAAATSSRPLANLALQLGGSLASGTGAAVANQVVPDNKYADLAGELLGGGAFLGATKLAQRAITPFPISPDRQAMNDVMQREGVDLSAGQQTGSQGLKYAESELGGGTAQALTERQQQQFTQAALAKAGISAERATPEVMRQADSDIGQQFDTLAANNSIIPDRQLGADIRNVWTDYHNLSGSDAKPIIGNSIQDIANWVQTGATVSGDQYKALRSRLSRAMAGTSNPELKGAIRGLQGALDGAMERSIAQTNPADLGAWQQARQDYANLMVLTDAVSGPGENTAMGLISPSKLRSVVANQNTRAYVRGQGDFADLARAGEATMKPLPQSGTAPRLSARNIGMALPTMAGAAIGGVGGNLPGAMLGSAAGAATPYLLGKALLSGPGTAYLTNQLWTTPMDMSIGAMGPLSAALINQTQQEKRQ